MTTIEIEQVHGFKVDPKTGAVTLACKPTTGDPEQVIVFKFGAVSDLLSAATACPLTQDGQPAAEYMRPLRPKRLMPFSLPNGESGVAFHVADRLAVPVVLPPSAIPLLRKAADLLEGMGKK